MTNQFVKINSKTADTIYVLSKSFLPSGAEKAVKYVQRMKKKKNLVMRKAVTTNQYAKINIAAALTISANMNDFLLSGVEKAAITAKAKRNMNVKIK